MQACTEIARTLIQDHEANDPSKSINLNKLRGQVSKKFKLKSIPSLTAIMAAVPEHYKKYINHKLLQKPVRTSSGIAVVAVMCKPHRCPHIAYTGNICVYCPGGPDSDFEYSTQSYTGYEPTSMRAIRARYDPMEQARGRVDQLRQLGHSVDKVEYIIMGGTFMSLSSNYRDGFIASLHNALSGYTAEDVDEAVRLAELSEIKCVGITIETRPDYCLDQHLTDMLRYGCTRLEIGVQSLYEDVARDTNRGHTVKAVCESFRLCKDAGFKVVSHMMPDLPNVGMERDIEQFRVSPPLRPEESSLLTPCRSTSKTPTSGPTVLKSTPHSSSAAQACTSSGALAATKTTPPTRSSISSPASSPWFPHGPGFTESSATFPCPSLPPASKTATSANSHFRE